MPLREQDEKFMAMALREAAKAAAEGEVPIGAVVVIDGKVVARGRNSRERTGDPTSHAEIAALRRAGRRLSRWRLTDAALFVTVEPCPMCAGAVVNARVGRLVFGCSDPKAGAAGSVFDIPGDLRLNHRPEVTSGVLEGECSELVRGFFTRRRRKGKEK